MAEVDFLMSEGLDASTPGGARTKEEDFSLVSIFIPMRLEGGHNNMTDVQLRPVTLVVRQRARTQSVLTRYTASDLFPFSLQGKRRPMTLPRKAKWGYSLRKCVLPSLFPATLIGLID